MTFVDLKICLPRIECVCVYAFINLKIYRSDLSEDIQVECMWIRVLVWMSARVCVVLKKENKKN